MNDIKGIDELKTGTSEVPEDVDSRTEKASILEAVDLVAVITSAPEVSDSEDKIRFENGDIGLERMAEEVHQMWSNWMKHLFTQGWVLTDQGFKINTEATKRWRRQMTTQYSQLSEDEKQVERDIARRYLNVAWAPENETEENHV